jgi:hypothetical protein
MKDFLNQELAIGDHVILIQDGYRSYDVGVIEKFTPKQIRVKINSYLGSKMQYPVQLVKILPEQLTWYVISK